jgi:hypothetical protein
VAGAPNLHEIFIETGVRGAMARVVLSLTA